MPHVFERRLVSDVIDDDDAVGAPVVAARDGAEALLPGGVPDLELASLALEVQGADLEVHTDGADVTLRVGVISEAEQ
eukprot:CAMPEP_0115522972 /NCGR_PEP_ID=MMETSP0271-20121206/80381_1 /TAXON_ID=71861 /ORGANISM="Scrippsiella trochoidea, Strain CCMP3099" /LENGTH=77 /DNA_ID=CAMNT_0002954339 /DNA_START=384 /DNA_END=617 /DNA_ORIENTATION=+